MTDQYFEEEEFNTQFNGKTVLRILSQTKPHWRWVIGFLVSVIVVSILDGYFTFLSKRIVDEGILAGNRQALMSIITIYGVIDPGTSRAQFWVLSTWLACWANECAMICAKACLKTCKDFH